MLSPHSDLPTTESDEMLREVYDELRKLARTRLGHEKPGQTLQATALVHEAYLRLTAGERADRKWDNQQHFFAAAADSMCRILIDRARRKQRIKHGGDRARVDLDDAMAIANQEPEELLRLNSAIEKLAGSHPHHATLVKLRFFVGMSHQEAAKALEISRSTADRFWKFAKAFLLSELSETTNS